jgi:uncharacterized protein (DUF58 family)
VNKYVRVHPARPLAPICVSGLILAVWWVVAHNSGAGWVQSVGDAIFGVLLVGVAGPAVAAARARVEVTAAPGDATAGRPVDITLTSRSRMRIQPLSPEGPASFVGPRRGDRGGDGTVTLLPARRGVHEQVVLEVATAAPFGLQWWSKQVTLRLSHGLVVAPRRGTPLPLPYRDDERHGDDGRGVPAPAGDLRGVRPYRRGDLPAHVHWPATAHSRELMVRDMELPRARPVTVAAHLPADPDRAERIAEQALATVVLLLDKGSEVVLETTEASGPVVQQVADRVGAGRRLARAVAGAEADPAGTVVTAL